MDTERLPQFAGLLRNRFCDKRIRPWKFPVAKQDSENDNNVCSENSPHKAPAKLEQIDIPMTAMNTGFCDMTSSLSHRRNAIYNV